MPRSTHLRYKKCTSLNLMEKSSLHGSKILWERGAHTYDVGNYRGAVSEERVDKFVDVGHQRWSWISSLYDYGHLQRKEPLRLQPPRKNSLAPLTVRLPRPPELTSLARISCTLPKLLTRAASNLDPRSVGPRLRAAAPLPRLPLPQDLLIREEVHTSRWEVQPFDMKGVHLL
jgi:hypothetical protein